jgi:calcineurin-like phosphoesterase family protein
MTVYFTSDNHYFHENIIRYCSRPFVDSAQMNEHMLENWNSRVEENDVGVFVGDISAGLKGRIEELRELIRRMNGKKILIRGNHDHQQDQWYIDSGFIAVYDYLNLGGVALSHYPLKSLSDKKFDESALGDFLHIVHGHVHEKGPNYDRHFNVAADRNNYKPHHWHDVIPEWLRTPFKENLNILLMNTLCKNYTLD